MKLFQPKVIEKALREKNIIGDLSDTCQRLSEERYNTEHNFQRRIPGLCPAEQESTLNNKLKNWWKLDFDTFQKEIKKSFKITIPLAERKDWHDYFDVEQAKITGLTRQLISRESQLNQTVFELFKLTDEEITLLDGNISEVNLN